MSAAAGVHSLIGTRDDDHARGERRIGAAVAARPVGVLAEEADAAGDEEFEEVH